MVKPEKRIGIVIPMAFPFDILPRQFYQSWEANYQYLLNHADELPFKIKEIRKIERPTFPIDANRNESIAYIKKYDCDISVWFDADQEFINYGTKEKEPDILFRLLKDGYDYPIYAGIYYLKKPPYQPVIMTADKNFSVFKAVFKIPKEPFFADMIGMGCVKIDREVFDKISAPDGQYFKYLPIPKKFITKSENVRFKYENNIHDVSEDKNFWKLVKKQTNYRIVVDPKIQVGHLVMNIITPSVFEGFQNYNLEAIKAEKGEIEFEKWWSQFEEPELVNGQNEQREEIKRAC